MTFRQVEKILRKAGWRCVRQNGSQYQYRHPNSPNLVSVHRHGSKDISIGVLKDIERDTGLSIR